MDILLLPLGGIAFLLFLLVLGAVGLAVATVLIAAIGRAWRFITRADARQRG